MGAPVSDVKAGEQASAESLLESFKSIDAAERRRHASVLNYWLSIKGDKDVAPIRDLDPLEISDAGPDSLLLELIGGGEDAEIKHSGDALKAHVASDLLSQAARPSLLGCIAGKLAIVAISRNFLAFEDEFPSEGGATRCWITLLPFSSTGVWVDYVYAFATLADAAGATAPAVETPAAEGEEAVSEASGDTVLELGATDMPQLVAEDATIEAPTEEIIEEPAESPADEGAAAETVAEPVGDLGEPDAVMDPNPEIETGAADSGPEPEPEAVAEKRPGFSKIFEALAGFHGTSVRVEPSLPEPPLGLAEDFDGNSGEMPEAPSEEALEPVTAAAAGTEPEPVIAAENEEPVAETAAAQPNLAVEGPLQSKLEDVRAKAEEARLAKLRSNIALYEGLGAAYDFALDAENSPEEYLRLVEAQGLKIQLRSPMTPVVKLAFNGMCDESTIGQLEAVLAWALKQDLPRGTLAEKIEAAGGIGPILNGQADEQAEAA